MVNTSTHTILGTHGLLSLSDASGDYISSIQLGFKVHGLLDDTSINNTNGYTSSKIESLIQGVEDKIDAIKYKDVIIDNGVLGNDTIVNHLTSTNPNVYTAYPSDTTVISGQSYRYVKFTLSSAIDIDDVKSIHLINTNSGLDDTFTPYDDVTEYVFATHATDGTDLGFDWVVGSFVFGYIFAQRGTDLFVTCIEEDPETYEYYLTLTDTNLLEVGDDLSGLSVTFKVNRFNDWHLCHI